MLDSGMFRLEKGEVHAFESTLSIVQRTVGGPSHAYGTMSHTYVLIYEPHSQLLNSSSVY